MARRARPQAVRRAQCASPVATSVLTDRSTVRYVTRLCPRKAQRLLLVCNANDYEPVLPVSQHLREGDEIWIVSERPDVVALYDPIVKERLTRRRERYS